MMMVTTGLIVQTNDQITRGRFQIGFQFLRRTKRIQRHTCGMVGNGENGECQFRSIGQDDGNAMSATNLMRMQHLSRLVNEMHNIIVRNGLSSINARQCRSWIAGNSGWSIGWRWGTAERRWEA